MTAALLLVAAALLLAFGALMVAIDAALGVTSRADLASNEYSEKDPRVVAINKIAASGKTPISANFQQAFNATNSPWLTLVRNAVFGDGKGVAAANDQINSVLAQQ